MRTTLDVADDVLAAAKERARREHRTVGEVVSDLLRQALTAPSPSTAVREPKAVYGLKPFPRRGAVVTNQVIDQLRGDDAY
jgi:hypothetical protein